MQPRRYMRRGKTYCKLDLLELAIYTRNIVPLTAYGVKDVASFRRILLNKREDERRRLAY